MLLTACKPQVTSPADQTSAAFTESTSESIYESTSEAGSQTETTAPTPIKYYIPKPYIDIEFHGDGTLTDAMDHVTCSLANKSNGSVTVDEVNVNGEKYSVPHLYVKKAGGVATLKYKELKSQSELLKLLEDGFTVEVFLVNHNRLDSSSKEQCMATSTQSGGYNFSVNKGRYIFSVHTDGAYRIAAYEKQYDNENLTHLMGIYDPTAKTSTLYINGIPEATVDAKGIFKLAKDNCWQTIVLGGDISASGTPELLSTNTRIADYKLYTASMTEVQVEKAYEAAVSKLTGKELTYEIIYADPDGMPDDAKSLFASVAASYADVYEPSTGLTAAPTVITYASPETASLAKEAKRPATVIFDIKLKDGELVGADSSGKELGSLRDCVSSLKLKIIPAFRIEDKSLKSALRTFINSNNIGDCFVISSDSSLLKSLCEATRSARPILDLTDMKDNEVTASVAFLKASACGTKTVLVNASALDNEKTLAMRARALSVFAVLDSEDVSEIHSAVFNGVMGIVTNDHGKVISHYESITEKTLNAPPLVVAHRGDIQNCPENILRSFISAEKSGASVIELDVWLTKDNHLVVNHDSKTNKWNEKLTCNDATREQLKKLKLASGGIDGDEVTFYDEVMEHFSKDGSDVVFTIEIKDKRNEVIDKVVELTEKYGMRDRVIIICMTHSIVRYAYEEYGYAVHMNQSYPTGGDDVLSSLAYACAEVVGLHSSYFSQLKNADARLSSMLRHRGIKYSVWTASSAKDSETFYSLEYPEFTGNYPHQSDKYARSLKITEDANGKITVMLEHYDRTNKDVTELAEFVPISGSVTYTDGKVSGSGAYAFRLKTKLPIVTEYEYFVYSTAETR